LLVFLPSLLAICVEAGAWQRAIRMFGVRARFGSVLRVRVVSESLAAILPLGAVWAETMKPVLFARHAGFEMSTSVAAMAVRKYLLLASQAFYVALGFLAGKSALEAGFSRATGTPRWALVALAIAAALGGLSTWMAAALGEGRAFRAFLRLLARFPNATWRGWLARSGEAANRMDGSVRRFFSLSWHERLVVILPCLGGWLLEGTETWLILNLLGLSIHWGDAVGVESLVVLARHVFVFLPGGLGAQELGYAAFLSGDDPKALAACAAFIVVKRAKELAWAGVGASLLFAGRRSSPSPSHDGQAFLSHVSRSVPRSVTPDGHIPLS
jgi:uncharacterized membrane protein YbhN (UPF0104 family)